MSHIYIYIYIYEPIWWFIIMFKQKNDQTVVVNPHHIYDNYRYNNLSLFVYIYIILYRYLYIYIHITMIGATYVHRNSAAACLARIFPRLALVVEEQL